MSSNSNIRVFVQWSEQTVFAGENIECQITFRNVAVVNKISKPLSHPVGLNGYAPTESKQRKTTSLRTTVMQDRNHTAANMRTMPISRGHQATLSFNMTVGETSQGDSLQGKGNPNEAEVKEHSHRRSVSIISLGITESGGDETASHLSLGERSRHPSRRHARASSLQIIPRRPGANISGPLSGRLTII
jgi:RAB6A-GEF complex partner protein 2